MQTKQHDECNQHAAFHKSNSHRQTDGRARPERRRRRQSPDPVITYDNRSHAEETNPAYDLRRQTVHVGKSRKVNLDILLRQHDKRCSQADHRHRLCARAPVFHAAVQTNNSSENHGRYDPYDKILCRPLRKISEYHLIPHIL